MTSGPPIRLADLSGAQRELVVALLNAAGRWPPSGPTKTRSMSAGRTASGADRPMSHRP
jgi:hypothetical protein